jgi:S1-C subfamily serine protease
MLYVTRYFHTREPVYAKAEKSIVQVEAADPRNASDVVFKTGFIYDNSSHIITSYDSFSEDDNRYSITFSDGSVYSSNLVGSDPFSGIRLLSMKRVPKDILVTLVMAK